MWRTFWTKAIVCSDRCPCEPQEASRGKIASDCTKGKVPRATASEESLERPGMGQESIRGV